MSVIQVNNLSVAYGDKPVLRGLSFAVESGEAVLIQGPSGCGKSTLLHAVCGLIPGSIPAEISGRVLLSGRDVRDLTVAERACEIGIVFQNPDTQLFCDTVEDEIAFGLENLCLPREVIGERIGEVLALTRLERLRFASPKELSGGQKQLVVLAAVLALDPKILLLDEALSQLDETGKAALTERLHDLRRKGRTLLMVDHDGALSSVATRTVDWEKEWL
ncbi:MAG: energy-coupling factor ABC transporter ATP-binding protein [Clostridiales bacterium]|nr:energy-coupling factor ABC transporter ATP-binding protein [Clostridiales bacterium]